MKTIDRIKDDLSKDKSNTLENERAVFLVEYFEAAEAFLIEAAAMFQNKGNEGRLSSANNRLNQARARLEKEDNK